MLRVHAGAAAMCRLSLNGVMVEYECHSEARVKVLFFCRRRHRLIIIRRFRALFAGVLVRVAEWDGALLGVAHLHRGFRDTLDGATHVTRARTCLPPACTSCALGERTPCSLALQDHSTRRGLLNMVSYRKRLLKYLLRKDLNKFTEVKKELGIR